MAGRPTILRHGHYFDPAAEPFDDMRQAYAPLVWQCRYGGVEVPDALWAYGETGRGRPYSEDQAEHMVRDDGFLRGFDAWADAFARFVGTKGKVEPGEFRAFGHKPGGHRLADAKLKWRALRMAAGVPPAGSSPAAQQRLGLNDDATLRYSKSEGEKLRE